MEGKLHENMLGSFKVEGGGQQGSWTKGQKERRTFLKQSDGETWKKGVDGKLVSRGTVLEEPARIPKENPFFPYGNLHDNDSVPFLSYCCFLKG